MRPASVVLKQGSFEEPSKVMVWSVFFWRVDALGTEESYSLELQMAEGFAIPSIASGHAPTELIFFHGFFGAPLQKSRGR